MTHLEKISHLIHFGLSFKKMTTETINDWANRKITEGSTDDFFLELFTAGTINKIIEVLSVRVVWNYNDLEFRGLILSYYKKYLILNPSYWLDVEKELVQYFQYLKFESGNDGLEDFLYYLADDYQLRKHSANGLLNMPEYLIDSLMKYDDYDKLQMKLTEEGLSGFTVANNSK